MRGAPVAANIGRRIGKQTKLVRVFVDDFLKMKKWAAENATLWVYRPTAAGVLHEILKTRICPECEMAIPINRRSCACKNGDRT